MREVGVGRGERSMRGELIGLTRLLLVSLGSRCESLEQTSIRRCWPGHSLSVSLICATLFGTALQRCAAL
eukprot:2647182-Amphidinium_carterae.1